ncbi:hypothetical protein HDV06_006792 [Boothiomyces sp. JEL0866]|nr:hypothetical protein HDV06_006792 [Boothiomyces sp. JEL0866]
MGLLTVGQYLDGTPLDYVSYTNALDIFALCFTLLYLLANVVLMIQIARGWLQIPPSKILSLVWYMNALLFTFYVAMILRYSWFSFPLLCWIYSVIGAVGVCSPNGNLESIYNKLEISYNRKDTACTKGSVIYHLKERKRMNLSNSTKNQEEGLAFNQIYYVVNADIILNWIGVVIWVISFFDEDVATPFGIVGSAIGYGHIMFVTVVFKLLRQVNMKKHYMDGTEKKSTTTVQQTTIQPVSIKG